MLPAVSDAGPLIHLAQVNRLHLLERLFGKIAIVLLVGHEVVDEGMRLGYPDAILVKDALVNRRITVVTPSSDLVRRATKLAKREKLSLSDSETLLLAKRLSQPLLTDERLLSVLARMYGIEVWNTWTVLLEALRVRLMEKTEIHAAITELGEKRHKLSSGQIKEIVDSANRLAS